MAASTRILTALVCTSYLCVAGSAAYGQMFESAQQFWLNERRAQSGAPWGSGWEYGYGPYDRRGYAPERQDRSYGPAPQVEVKSPQYFDYKPDTLVSLPLDQLCQVKVASNAGVLPAATPSSFADACALAPELSLRVLPEVAAALTKYYGEHSQFVWLDDGRATAGAQAAMAEMAKADMVGLAPSDYAVAPLAADAGEGPAALKEALRFELALSAKVLTYVLDATRGRVDPNRISGYHDLPRKKIDLVAAMEEIAQAGAVDDYLARRNPQNDQFRALTAELQKLRRDATPAIALPAGLFVRPGESHPVLPDLVAAIARTASPELKRKHAAVLASPAPEKYAGALIALVRDFQRENGLRPDGIVGGNTVAALRHDSTAEKVRKLELAMERLRWLPADLGARYVFLNQPAFRVAVIDGGREQLSMPVVIGKASNQTYFFADTIDAVEYNPYWNMPRSIIVNEMLPKLYRDPTYLDRAGYEVINGRGRTVSSASIAWDLVAYNKASVEVRQPPGARNALGRLKIEFPNRHAIYMHDTPQKSLFKQARRAFSHGCVRLEDPQAMAAALLGKPVDYVRSRIAAGANATEQVERKIPVYLAYFTAWPDSSGAVAYFDDVYRRDDHLARALAKTAAVRKTAG